MSAERLIVSPALTDFSPDEIIATTDQVRSAGRRTGGWRFGPAVLAGRVFRSSRSGSRRKSTGLAAARAVRGSKLVGTGAVGPAEQGWSVALSADGNTAIVGGIADNKVTGAAWVYTRSGGVWTQQGTKLVGTGPVGHAGQACLRRAVRRRQHRHRRRALGQLGHRGSVGLRPQRDVWNQQGNKLVGTGAVGNAGQGVSVALSADGNTAIVGGSDDNAGGGAAWIYARNGGVWTQLGNKLVGTGAVGNAGQGISVALSADGNTAIVGGVGDNKVAGAAWVYARNGGVWNQLGNKLVGTGAVGNAGQGISVALSADGNTAIVGGVKDNSGTGAAWVFTRNGDVWNQQGNKLVGTGAVGHAGLGVSVAVSADGNTAIMGGVEDNSYTGAAWAFTRNGGVWNQQGNKLVGTDAVGSARQGHSVALSADGNTAIVGGFTDNKVNGAAWVHNRSGGVPTLA